jgi:ATP-dependent RNA helicase DeaD
MMREIERYTGRPLKAMKIPTGADVAARRTALFKEAIAKTIGEGDLGPYLSLVEEVAEEGGFDMAEIAAAAARLARGDKPLEVSLEPLPQETSHAEEGMVRFFLAAGSRAGVRPGDVVGAIANEAGVPGKLIGAIDVYDDFTFVEVPREYEAQVLKKMARAKIRGRPVQIRPAAEDTRRTSARRVDPRKRPTTHTKVRSRT